MGCFWRCFWWCFGNASGKDHTSSDGLIGLKDVFKKRLSNRHWIFSVMALLLYPSWSLIPFVSCLVLFPKNLDVFFPLCLGISPFWMKRPLLHADFSPGSLPTPLPSRFEGSHGDIQTELVGERLGSFDELHLCALETVEWTKVEWMVFFLCFEGVNGRLYLLASKEEWMKWVFEGFSRCFGPGRRFGKGVFLVLAVAVSVWNDYALVFSSLLMNGLEYAE